MFCPDEMKKYSLNLIVSAKREAQMSWLEPESKYKNVSLLVSLYLL
jgi:hypothetical protein